MKIIPLSEGSFTIGYDKVFMPFNEACDKLEDRSKGSLLVEVQPFCIITSRDIILLDTGLGYSNRDGVLQIHQNLMDAGINPLEVTKVILTHLHKDHSGGISKEDTVLGHRFLSFPQATYYVSAAELSYGLEKGAPSFTPKEFEILNSIPNIILLPESGEIDGYINHWQTGGHSPYHQAILIEEDGEKIFFGGDEAPQLKQLKTKYAAKYDNDPQRAMELRAQWLLEGTEKKWTFLFYHDIKTPTYNFTTLA
jgi:glyoxylase-like metal-dependent hydrolase (beta-lactamase superfamily II)